MSKRTDAELIADIQEAIARILRYTDGMDYKTFVADTMIQDAVIRNLEIIGEASKRVSDRLRNTHPDLPWKQMAGSRDRLIHDYFGVNLDIVWEIVSDELPRVLSGIERVRTSDRDGG